MLEFFQIQKSHACQGTRVSLKRNYSLKVSLYATSSYTLEVTVCKNIKRARGRKISHHRIQSAKRHQLLRHISPRLEYKRIFVSIFHPACYVERRKIRCQGVFIKIHRRRLLCFQPRPSAASSDEAVKLFLLRLVGGCEQRGAHVLISHSFDVGRLKSRAVNYAGNKAAGRETRL